MMDELLKDLTPEEKLTLTLCHLEFDDDQKSKISSLISEIKDWDRFLDLVNRHGIAALVWYNLTGTKNDKSIPSGCLSKLRSSYLLSLSRNSYLYSSLAAIIGLLKTENIKIVLLKGIALEKTLYGNKGLRQMTDIDLLVGREDVLRVRKILMMNGFRSLPLKSPLYRNLILFYGKHIPSLVKEDCSVDVHFRLFEGESNHLTEKVIMTSTPAGPDEDKAFIPSPLLHFLYLVKHLAYHEENGGTQLRLFTDLNLMLRSYHEEIITEQLIDYAEEAGLESQLATRLYQLNRYFGIDYPAWMNQFINKFDHSDTSEKFLGLLKNPKDEDTENPHLDLTNQVREIPGIFNKALYIAGFIFPTLSFMKSRYGTGTRLRAIIYYPVRWFGFLKFLFRGRR